MWPDVKIFCEIQLLSGFNVPQSPKQMESRDQAPGGGSGGGAPGSTYV